MKGTRHRKEIPHLDLKSKTNNNTNKKYLPKPTANLILNGERLNVLRLRSGTRQECLHFFVLEVVGSAIRKKEMKEGKEGRWEGHYRNKGE